MKMSRFSLVYLLAVGLALIAAVSAVCDCDFKPDETCDVVTLDQIGSGGAPTTCFVNEAICGGCFCNPGGRFTCEEQVDVVSYGLVDPEQNVCVEFTQNLAICPQETVTFQCSNVDRVTWEPTFFCNIPGDLVPAGATVNRVVLYILQASNATVFLRNANTGFSLSGSVTLTYVNVFQTPSDWDRNWGDTETETISLTLPPNSETTEDIFQLRAVQSFEGQASIISAIQANAGNSGATTDVGFNVDFVSDISDFQGGPINVFSAGIFLFAVDIS
mmetsp:Transcript_9415/g.16982  ORF Transcript_9415/g.16982 Transcript_9415/m.16982 type:complete len:274 (-) Transcript_9415:65-886(-)